MSTSDPTMTDTATLIASLKRDVGAVQGRLREASAWLGEAMTTLHELERRNPLPPPSFKCTVCEDGLKVLDGAFGNTGVCPTCGHDGIPF